MTCVNRMSQGQASCTELRAVSKYILIFLSLKKNSLLLLFLCSFTSFCFLVAKGKHLINIHLHFFPRVFESTSSIVMYFLLSKNEKKMEGVLHPTFQE